MTAGLAKAAAPLGQRAVPDFTGLLVGTIGLTVTTGPTL